MQPLLGGDAVARGHGVAADLGHEPRGLGAPVRRDLRQRPARRRVERGPQHGRDEAERRAPASPSWERAATATLPVGADCARASSSPSRVLPTPGSPSITTSRPSVAARARARRASGRTRRPRPTSGRSGAGGGTGPAARRGRPPAGGPRSRRCRARVVSGSGRTPSSRSSTRTQSRYWLSASARRPLAAYRRISARCAGSWSGSSASRRRAVRRSPRPRGPARPRAPTRAGRGRARAPPRSSPPPSRCQSSKRTLSRSPKPASRSSRCSATAAVSGAIAAVPSPARRRPARGTGATSIASARASSADRRPADRRPSGRPSAERSVESVRRSAARPRSGSASGHSRSTSRSRLCGAGRSRPGRRAAPWPCACPPAAARRRPRSAASPARRSGASRAEYGSRVRDGEVRAVPVVTFSGRTTWMISRTGRRGRHTTRRPRCPAPSAPSPSQPPSRRR